MLCVCVWGGGDSAQIGNSELSGDPHPDTIDYAKRLIDELQSKQISSACKARVPRVPRFVEEASNRKMSVLELLGTSDSEAMSEGDFSQLQGGSSEGDESEQASGEDMYNSEHESKSESGESSASNYETSSSFEARK